MHMYDLIFQYVYVKSRQYVSWHHHSLYTVLDLSSEEWKYSDHCFLTESIGVSIRNGKDNKSCTNIRLSLLNRQKNASLFPN